MLASSRLLLLLLFCVLFAYLYARNKTNNYFLAPSILCVKTPREVLPSVSAARQQTSADTWTSTRPSISPVGSILTRKTSVGASTGIHVLRAQTNDFSTTDSGTAAAVRPGVAILPLTHCLNGYLCRKVYPSPHVYYSP